MAPEIHRWTGHLSQYTIDGFTCWLLLRHTTHRGNTWWLVTWRGPVMDRQRNLDTTSIREAVRLAEPVAREWAGQAVTV